MGRQEALQVLGEIAADQWGLITTAQAAEAGVGKMTLSRLAAAGLLSRIGYGVYGIVVAGQPSHLEIRAAWLRLDPGRAAWQRPTGDPDSGVISHGSACVLHDIGDIPATTVDITVPRRRTTREPDVRLLPGTVEPLDVAFVDGLPVTTAERTIADLLADRADGGHIGGVIADAQRSGLLDIPALADRVAPHAKAYGAPASDGRALLALLLESVGEHLRDDQALAEAAQAGAAQATELLLTGLDEILTDRGLLVRDGQQALVSLGFGQSIHASLQQAMAPAEASLARAIRPALDAITANLDQQFAPLRVALSARLAASMAPGVDAVTASALTRVGEHVQGIQLSTDALGKLADAVVGSQEALKIPATAWTRTAAPTMTNHLPKSLGAAEPSSEHSASAAGTST
ncbi:type IV toxin-antitoxin system AbiEi family antitoxin domain-containing protein [Kitasatospora sp. NPDC050543]|uniref:type IV toxin-antitoxin system AbiEi family antitoxin domain-containing protein n=1 Tax=Kitasatospora sp. NPDC050543 TaxID=3364054 RepID=UPI0037BDAF5D